MKVILTSDNQCKDTFLGTFRVHIRLLAKHDLLLEHQTKVVLTSNNLSQDAFLGTFGVHIRLLAKYDLLARTLNESRLDL